MKTRLTSIGRRAHSRERTLLLADTAHHAGESPWGVGRTVDQQRRDPGEVDSPGGTGRRTGLGVGRSPPSGVEAETCSGPCRRSTREGGDYGHGNSLRGDCIREVGHDDHHRMAEAGTGDVLQESESGHAHEGACQAGSLHS